MKEPVEDFLLVTAGAGTLGAAASGPPAARRRPYESPELVAWGSLTQLTLGGAGIEYDIDNGATKAV